eukprot:SAG11_NODE_8120_length_1058_cov_1.943691_1_plen_152_part_00
MVLARGKTSRCYANSYRGLVLVQFRSDGIFKKPSLPILLGNWGGRCILASCVLSRASTRETTKPDYYHKQLGLQRTSMATEYKTETTNHTLLYQLVTDTRSPTFIHRVPSPNQLPRPTDAQYHSVLSRQDMLCESFVMIDHCESFVPGAVQ